MRHLAVLLLLLPGFGSFACRGEEVEPYTIQVAASRPAVATGETGFVPIVLQSTERDYDSGWCGPTHVLPDLSLSNASCSPDCNAVVGELGMVAVTSESAGTKTITVDAATSDGKKRALSFTLDFRRPTRIDAARDVESSPSGTVFPMVAGDQQEWHIVVGDEQGPLQIDACKIQVTSAGRGPHGSWSCSLFKTQITALEAGSARLTFSYGGLSKVYEVKSIDLAQIEKVELRAAITHRSPYSSSPVLVPVDDPAPVFGDLTSPLLLHYRCDEPATNQIVPLVTTRDGTVALGGSRLLAAEPPDAMDLTQRLQVATARIHRLVDGRIVGRFGEALLDAPYIVTAGCNESRVTDAGAKDADVQDGSLQDGELDQ